MAITDEQWMAFIVRARFEQPLDTPSAVYEGVIGRSIRRFVDKVIEFWGKHRDKLVPFLTQVAIAALDALVSAQADIDRIDPPGPR